MNLKNQLYRIVKMDEIDDGKTLATISLIRESEIFKAHFPDLPILPGACLVQISKEFIEDKIEQKISITKFKNLKFLKTINPNEFPEVTLCFSYQKMEEQYSASVTYTKEEHLFCKLEYLFITQ